MHNNILLVHELRQMCMPIPKKETLATSNLEINTAVLGQITKSNFHLNTLEHAKSISDVGVPWS